SLSVPVKVSTIEKRFNDTRYAPQDSVPIAENVTDAVEIYLTERADKFPGVLVERKAIRTYPYGSVAVHVLGYVGQINDKELAERGVANTSAADTSSTTTSSTTTKASKDSDEELRSDYRPGDSIGKSGVEQAYEDDLRGVPGRRTIEVNARGDLVDVVKVDAPKQGNDVWLTIDIDVQAHAERLLETKINSLRGRRDDSGNRLNAPQGSVVVQDPHNGELIAMASYPDYDPTTLVNGISQERWEAFNDPNSGMPLVNWAIGGTYAPGSTFKLFSAYAGLKTGYLTGANSVIMDNGVYKIENCKSGKCEVQNAGRARHGRVDLARSLTVSSDVYYYRLADKLWNLRGQFGETPIQDAAKAFGLGAKTGVPLVGENAGRIPTPAARREAYEARPDLFLTGDWRSGDNINMSIGQGDVLVTPLQITNAYSAFANGGTVYQPQVALKVTRSKDPTKDVNAEGNTELVRMIEPKVTGTITFEGDQWNQIFRGLLGVTQERGGTAYASWHETPTAWPMAGKTGTAQVKNKADSALFVGWGPAQPGVEPEYTVGVVIPEAGFGGVVSAPLAFRILQPVSKDEVPPACPVSDTEACELAALQAAEQAKSDASSGTRD
ncbi:MAG: hypothetical protein KDB26_12140, partial [Microthrixaceae bacterium]|nr:hypothetical protein [Microthrixaceae bacterium]